MVRRLAAPALAVITSLAVAACGGDPSTGDFQGEAESFIEDAEGDLAQALEDTFSDAECEEPESTAVGTTFACTATNASGEAVQFEAEISGETTITVGAAQAGGAPGSTVPPTTAAD